MESKHMTRRLLVLLMSLCASFALSSEVSADIVVPAVHAIQERQGFSFMVFIGMAIEYMFIRNLFHTSVIKSVVVTASINLLSSIMGVLVMIVLPDWAIGAFIGGARLWEWIYAFLLCVFLNTCLETLGIRYVFRLHTNRSILFWMFVANALSVGCILWSLPEFRRLVFPQS
jgi:hypothetical protein